MKPQLPIGQSDFKIIRQEGRYYVDKSLFIKEVMDGGTVVLATRPRRFGKTLNLSMLRYFYGNDGDYRALFQGLDIARQGGEYLEKMGRHPVVAISFKNVKQTNWKEAYTTLLGSIRLGTGFFESIYPDIRSQLVEKEQEVLDGYFSKTPDMLDVSVFLPSLCHALHLYYGAPPVILIDEYDTPLIHAWLDNYYNDCVGFMRSFMGGLKDNLYLEKAVLTGIIRVARESLFSGLNNPSIWSVTSSVAGDKFGFTEPEVRQLLAACGMNGSEMDDIRHWYNGYLFGEQEIYNPWSILQYIFHFKDGFRAHWVNTSDNRLLKNLFFDGDAAFKEDIDRLLAGQWLHKPLTEHLTFQDLKRKKEAVWNLLLASGYLNCRNIAYDDDAGEYKAELSIPNKEVEYVYRQSVRTWLAEQMREDRFDEMVDYLVQGQLDSFKEILHQFLEQVARYHDTPSPNSEQFYHALFLGMLVRSSGRFEISSNRESGLGRYDIALFPRRPDLHKALVIEIKSPSKLKKETLKQALNAAVRQIKLKNYATGLRARGAQAVLQVALAVQGKEFLVKEVKE